MKKYLMMLLVSIGMVIGMAGFAPAHADTVTDLSNIQYGASHFKATDKVTVTGKLKLASGAKVYLNVQAKPMRPSQIVGKCRTAKVGTHFFNEMVDPNTGRHVFKSWHVQAGDNVFCLGHDHLWHKKSCGNIAKGLFGVPKPPARLIIHGKVVVRDYVKWHYSQVIKVIKTGSAYAHVKTDTCEAAGSVNNKVHIFVTEKLAFKNRTMADATVTGGRQVMQQVRQDSDVKSRIKTKIVLKLKGSATAMCTTTPPPPPPPVTPTYSCDTLHVTPGDHSVTVDTFKTSQSNATFKNADIDWGDGKSTTSASPVGLNHSYSGDGPFTIKATAHFDVNGVDKTATSSGCMQSVSFTTQPPQHWVNIGCTGFEEISGGGSMIVKCDVSTDDQSAQIALAAHSNDANSRVSGINCFSQGGAPTCKGNGTYEFTVTGVNDGTTVLSSSVTAKASANGVSDTFTSDPFPVDPSGGGF